MKKIYYLFFIFFQFIQSQDSQEFIGALKINDSSLITYKIVFKINNTSLEGYSLSDFGGEHETKSLIKGNYENNLISFKEVSTVYTKSNISLNDFCYVHMEPTKFKNGRTKHFSSAFKGFFADGESCIDGKVLLNSSKKIEKLVSRVSKKIKKSKKIADTTKKKIQIVKQMDTLNMNFLKADKTMHVFTKKSSIELFLFDGGKEDGDKVSIFVDNKKILSNYLINFNKKKLTIPLINAKTTIKIKAENIGSISTNTAIVEIITEKNKIRALTNLKSKQTTSVVIIKEKL